LFTILVTFGLETPEFSLLTIAPFSAIRQKSAYLRISWTYLDLLYRFGRRIGEDDYPNVRLAVDQGTLLWQLVKFRGWPQTSPGTTLLLASAFDNGLADRKSELSKLVNFRPTISEFSLLKRAIFAAICARFDDALHSSCRRSKTDRKITILISAS